MKCNILQYNDIIKNCIIAYNSIKKIHLTLYQKIISNNTLSVNQKKTNVQTRRAKQQKGCRPKKNW